MLARGVRFANVLGLRPLPALAYFVGYFLTLLEGPEPGALYGGVVDEDILTTFVRGDEAVALLGAEPLYCSLGHQFVPAFPLLGLTTGDPSSPSTRSIPRFKGPGPDTPRYQTFTGMLSSLYATHLS